MAITKFIPEIWSAALLERFAQVEVVAPTVNRDYEGEVQSGNTVHVTSVTTPTIVNYKTGSGGNARTISPQDLTDTQIDLLIDQEKAYAFKVQDIDRTQAAGSFEPVTRDAGAALVEDYESYIAGLMMSDGTDDSAGTVAMTTAAQAFAAVKTLRTSLGVAKVPMSDRYLAVNPEFSGLLLDESSKLTSVNEAGSDVELRNGVLFRLLGFTVVETSALNAGTPTAVGYHRSAVAYANQIAATEALRDTGSFSDIVRGLHVYGAKVLRPTAVRIYSGVAA
jgi:coat protein Gp5